MSDVQVSKINTVEDVIQSIRDGSIIEIHRFYEDYGDGMSLDGTWIHINGNFYECDELPSSFAFFEAEDDDRIDALETSKSGWESHIQLKLKDTPTTPAAPSEAAPRTEA